MNYLKALGNVLRELRLQKKMTQRQLAQAVNLHVVYISRLERGCRTPSLNTLLRLALLLDTPLPEIIKKAEDQVPLNFILHFAHSSSILKNKKPQNEKGKYFLPATIAQLQPALEHKPLKTK